MNITVLNENRPVFIALGNTRIKLNNIKNYGLDYETINEVVSEKTIYFSGGEKLGNRILGSLDIIQSIAMGTGKLITDVQLGDSYVKEEKRDVKYKILYITTYQGDNFKFHEKYVHFNIQEKMEELDRYFCA